MDFILDANFLKEAGVIILSLIALYKAKKKWDLERNEINQKINYELEKLSKESQSESLKIFAEMDAKNKADNATLRTELLQIISTQNNTIAKLNHQVTVIQRDLEKCHEERGKLMILLENTKFPVTNPKL